MEVAPQLGRDGGTATVGLAAGYVRESLPGLVGGEPMA